MDKISSVKRSENMRRIRSKNMKPEMIVRRFAHSLGYRYRLHQKDLPGKPDLVFPGRKKIIFVHGCFWHKHGNCKIARIPKSNQDYWIPKLNNNKMRDRVHRANLKKLGWKTLVIWECTTTNTDKLSKKITRFLGAKN